jgi:hypothetical protein
MEDERTPMFHKAGQILRLKCPRCGKANVFYKAKYPFISRPQMLEVCPNCGYRYDREPGFFSGAVYVSYGLALLEGLITFFLARYLVFGLSITQQILVTLAAVMFLSVWNYRLARVLWLNLFPVN